MATPKPEIQLPLSQRIRQILRPRSFSRYLIVGALNTAAGLLGFPIIYWLFKDKLSINAILVANTILNNLIGFILHKFVTFKSENSPYDQLPKYIALSLFGLAVNILVMDVTLKFFKISPIIVAYATTFLLALVLMIVNYFGMAKFIFKKHEK